MSITTPPPHLASAGGLRLLAGKRIHECAVEAVLACAAAFHGLAIDLGTGDGRFARDYAAAHSAWFVIGIDADAAAMDRVSRLAARPAAKGGLPNLRFAVAALESLPAGLEGAAALLTVHFPWGSLLRAAAGLDAPMTARIASLVAPGGSLRLLLSESPRDGDGLTSLDPAVVASAFEPYGLVAREVRPATIEDAREVHSSWGKRLLQARDRSAWAFDLSRHQ